MREWIGFVLLAVACLDPSAALGQTFPADSGWLELAQGGTPVGDVQGDATGYRDVVGDAANPVAYVYVDPDHLYFRVRADGDPLKGPGDFNSGAWGVEIDTDGGRTAYEFLALVDGVSNPAVRLRQNTTPGLPNDPLDQAETLLATYPTATYARVVAAPSMFGGDPDFFVDWAVDLADLFASGVDLSEPLLFVFGTSNNKRTLNADLWGTTMSLDTLWSDAVLCNAGSCEPCVDSSCLGCASDVDCGNPMLPACQPDGSCGQCSATNDDLCMGTTPVCNVGAAMCAGCASDGDCSDPANPACQLDGRCGACSATNDDLCTGTTPVCDVGAGMCATECTDNGDCPSPRPFCGALDVCIECLDDGDCSGGTPVCDMGTCAAGPPVPGGDDDAGASDAGRDAGGADAASPGTGGDDASVSDAGTRGDDASVPDAGARADADIGSDDAGVAAGGFTGGGCGCRLAGSGTDGSAPGAAAAALALFASGARLRRRRRSA